MRRSGGLHNDKVRKATQHTNKAQGPANRLHSSLSPASLSSFNRNSSRAAAALCFDSATARFPSTAFSRRSAAPHRARRSDIRNASPGLASLLSTEGAGTDAEPEATPAAQLCRQKERNVNKDIKTRYSQHEHSLDSTSRPSARGLLPSGEPTKRSGATNIGRRGSFIPKKPWRQSSYKSKTENTSALDCSYGTTEAPPAASDASS